MCTCERACVFECVCVCVLACVREQVCDLSDNTVGFGKAAVEHTDVY